MKSIKIYIVPCILFFPILIFGQSENSSTKFSDGSGIYKVENFKQAMQSERIMTEFPNNQIFIEQIGAENQVNTNISSDDLNLTFNQNGFNNSLSLNIAAEKLSENILQEGAYNQVFDFVNSAYEEVSLNLIQKGENLLFERYGSNSIGNKIQFNMTGRDSSIIIRNFK